MIPDTSGTRKKSDYYTFETCKLSRRLLHTVVSAINLHKKTFFELQNAIGHEYFHTDRKYHAGRNHRSQVHLSKLSNSEQTRQLITMVAQNERHVCLPQQRHQRQQWLTHSLSVSLGTKGKRDAKYKNNVFKRPPSGIVDLLLC